jgi:hypothetical protein
MPLVGAAIAVPICCRFYVHAFELALQLQCQNIDFMTMLWVTVIYADKISEMYQSSLCAIN